MLLKLIDCSVKYGILKKASFNCIFIIFNCFKEYLNAKSNFQMIVKSQFIFLLLLLFCTNARSQQVSEKGNRVTQLEAGYLAGVSGDGFFFVLNQGFGYSVAHGYKWTDFMVMGGIGFEKLEDGNLLPLFIQVGKPVGKKQRTVFRLKGGYALGFRESPVVNQEYNYKGGWMLQPAFGFRMLKRKKLELKTWVGYKYQQGKFEFKPFAGNRATTSVFHYHFLTLNIGVEF